MFQVTVNTEIEAPADVVYDYIADPTHNPDWQSGIESTEWTSDPPFGVGSTYDQILEYKGTVTSYLVTAREAGKSITVESQRGATISTTVKRTVQELNESRCRVRVDLTGRLRSWRQLTKPLVTRMIRGSVEADYRRLKRKLEDDGTEPDSDSG